MASCAARLISAGAEKSGKPCARLTASYCIACRVISRITDSVKCSTLSERERLGWAETWVMGSSLAQELPPRDMNGSGSVQETLNHAKGHEGTRRYTKESLDTRNLRDTSCPRWFMLFLRAIAKL